MKALTTIFFTLLSLSAVSQTYEPSDTVAMAPPTPQSPPPVITLHVPTFISPNNDDVNDVFHLNTDPNDRVEIKVYSRWGNLVYDNDDYQNDYSPTNLSDGVYAFWIRIYVGEHYEDFAEMVTIIK